MLTPFFVATIVYAQSGPTLKTWITSIGNFFNEVSSALISLAIIIFVIGVIRFLWDPGNQKRKEEAKNFLGWGLLILFVLFSVWGIVNLILSIFALDKRGFFPQPRKDPYGISDDGDQQLVGDCPDPIDLDGDGLPDVQCS